MIYTLSKIYIIVFIIYSIFGWKLHITKRQFIVFWGLFAFSFSVVAYNMNPHFGWDVVRHFEYMNQIRGSGISFWDFLFNNKALVGGGSYTNLLVFNIMRYLVVCITENNFLLPASCAFIDYSILGYIVMDWESSNNENYSINIFTLLLSFTFMPYVHMVSGMRNALCASIMGLAVYLYLYKSKSIFLFMILTITAVTIHPAAIITVPFVFFAKMKLKSFGFAAVFAVAALSYPAAQRLSYSQKSFLRLIGQKYITYTADDQYRASRTPLYGVLIVTAIFLLIYFLLYRRFNKTDNQSNNKKVIYNFLAIYMLYIWGNIGNYDMILRPSYVLGTLTPILSSFLSDKEIWSHNGMSAKIESIVSLGAAAGTMAICLYVCYHFHTSYSQYF